MTERPRHRAFNNADRLGRGEASLVESIYRMRIFRVVTAVVALALFCACVSAQDNHAAAPSETARSDSKAAEPQPLVDIVVALQAEVRNLHSQVADLQAKEERSQEQVRALQEQLLRSQGAVTNANAPSSAAQDAFATPMNSRSTTADAAQAQDLAARVSQLEEGQELLNSKVVEQSQTKLESGSKYRVRFSGIVLLNVFANRGGVDNQDFPTLAVPVAQPFSENSFGASLRQSQLAFQAFGPNIGGARTSAHVDFDFAGGFPQETPNGQTMGVMRLRTAAARFDWNDTSVIAGQDHLFFAPLAPTSLATLAVPSLAYAGNLWSWTPQVRVEHRIHLNEKSSLLVQGGILDSLSGDLPSDNQNAEPSWGEQSGQPAYAARVAWTHGLFGQELTLGTGGYYGRQSWGFGRHVDGWASTFDVSVPLGNRVSITGTFYRGRGVGGLGGAIGQNLVTSGSLFSPTGIFKGLDSMGGWMQLKYKLRENFQINAAYGEDNPYASELDKFPSTFSYNGLLFTRNQSPMVNFIYQARSNVELSAEYRRLRTMILNAPTQTANHITGSIGYRF